MSRDLLDDRYGRFRELPLALAAHGLRVRGICLSYRNRPEGEVDDTSPEGTVRWLSLAARRLLSPGKNGYWAALERVAGEDAPDIVWAGSDALQCRLGVAAARRLGARLVLDLYDNFESYPLARVPGVNAMLRASVRASDAVSCISAPLARKLREDYGYRGPVEVVENAIPRDSFVPRDKARSRARFGLPAHARIVGTAGALSRSRGIGCLLRAFESLSPRHLDLHLVLAGPLDPGVALPSDPRVHYLGLLPATEIPELLPALDVSVICNRDSEFGRYCFPQKLYESLACQVPVVVAGVGAMAELLESYPDYLFPPEDDVVLARRIEALLVQPSLPPLPVPTWPQLGARLHALMSGLLPPR
jgi:teichuronic acid biosynthesis glycosyltransferase TuaC